MARRHRDEGGECGPEEASEPHAQLHRARGGRMPGDEHIRKEAALEGESYEHERAEYEHGAAKRKKHKRGGATEGHKMAMRLDRPGRKRGGSDKWIQGTGVDKPGHKGRLHRALHVPEGEPIPAGKLSKALHSGDSHLQHMAQFAKNVKK